MQVRMINGPPFDFAAKRKRLPRSRCSDYGFYNVSGDDDSDDEFDDDNSDDDSDDEGPDNNSGALGNTSDTVDR